MKSFIKLLLASVLFAPVWLLAGQGVWSSAGPTYEGRNVGISALAVDPAAPATAFASGAWVWKSADSGGSWKLSDSGISNSTVEALAFDPTNSRTLYAGSYGVFKSTDGGANWKEVSEGFGYYKNFVASLAVDPVAPTTLYAGLGGGFGLWKSSDGGANWVKSDSGMVAATIKALVIDPRAHLTVYAATELNGVWKSRDGGTSWLAAGLASEGVYALAASADGVLYAAGRPSLRASDGTYGVFKSSDGGATWTAINSGLPTSNGKTSVDGRGLAIDAASGTIYLATYGAGVYRSSDSGASWTAFNSGIPEDVPGGSSGARNLRTIAAVNGTLYVGGDTGVYAYSGAGTDAGGFSVSANSSGGSDALTLTAQLRIATADAGQNGSLYVAAALPGGSWYVHNGSTWTPWAGGVLPAYFSGRLADTAIPILNGMDVRALAGVSVVVGYGLNEADLLSNKKYSVVYTIR